MASSEEISCETAGNGPAVNVMAALLAAAVISEMGLFIMPLLIGGMVRGYGIAEGHVGFVITAQVATFSLMSLGFSPFVHRLNRRRIALAGAATIIAGNLLTFAAVDMLRIQVLN